MENTKQHVRALVLKYGQNPASYLALEDDKSHFFGQQVDGVIAYGCVGNVIVVQGDPICAAEDFCALLSEFDAFCNAHGYICVFSDTTDVFLDVYTQMGYGHIKCGEEARFDLEDYNLKGGKAARLRADINHANKAGLTTYEYKPNAQRDESVEKGIAVVSDKWMDGKKSGELGFSVGGVGLDNPMDRRYFYAKNEAGDIVGFNVFIPFAGMDGYLADVTRRLPDAPGGVTEKLTYDGFMVFREEGKKWGSMGLSPLANLHEEGIKDSAVVKMLAFIYEKCNDFYGFKALHRAKERYNPSAWMPGYYVFSGKMFSPHMAYALIKIKNPNGIKDYMLGFLKEIHTKMHIPHIFGHKHE